MHCPSRLLSVSFSVPCQIYFFRFIQDYNEIGVGRLGLGSGPQVVGRLGSGMRVGASFQKFPRGSIRVRVRVRTPRRGSIRVRAGVTSGGIFSRGLSPRGSCIQAGYLLESVIYDLKNWHDAERDLLAIAEVLVGMCCAQIPSLR